MRCCSLIPSPGCLTTFGVDCKFTGMGGGMLGFKIWVVCTCVVGMSISGVAVSVEPDSAETSDAAQMDAIAPSALQAWKKLLLYTSTWFSGERSIVDDPTFFIDPQGRQSAIAEWNATIRAFSHGTPSQRQEALCKYPARRRFLEESLQQRWADPIPDLPSEACQKLRIYSEQVRSDAVSLVFSSYYAGNPASLFGHTFLKFRQSGKTVSPLLDYGVNHSAHQTTSNSFLYPLLGLSGGFPGYLTLMPYYVKVQEYNNAESRDLWEYELNLTSDESSFLLLVIFELFEKRIDYYYLDDNCSFVMLALLDAARPTLNLASQFHSWVVPADTVRVVARVPAFVRNIHFRPSNLRRYLQFEKSMTDAEREAFRLMLFTPNHEKTDGRGNVSNGSAASAVTTLNHSAIVGLNTRQQARVLDLALDYLNAQRQGTDEQWERKRSEILQLRAQLMIQSEPRARVVPTAEAPHQSYPPTRLSAGLVSSHLSASPSHAAALLGWRMTLHTMESPLMGLGADLGISFVNIELLLRSRAVRLREFELFSIESMPRTKPHLAPLSWAFALGYNDLCFAGCGRTFGNFELGLPLPSFGAHDRSAIRAGLTVGYQESRALFAEPFLVAIANIPLSSNLRWVNRASLGISLQRVRPERFLAASTKLSYRPIEPWEIQLSADRTDKEVQMSARLQRYF